MDTMQGWGRGAAHASGTWWLLAALCAGHPIPASPAGGGRFSIAHFTTGASGTSQGNPFALAGTVGLFGVERLDGGNYELMGGWQPEPGIGAEPTPATLTASYDAAAGVLVLSWSNALQNFALETSTDLGAFAAWSALPGTAQDIVGEFQIRLQPQRQRQFYRLKRASTP